MSRPAVLAAHFQGSWVSAALDEHRADRDALLASLTSSLQHDARVHAAWLWGSFGRGDADDLSDLDPWIVVADEAVGEMGMALRLYAERTGTFLTGGEIPHNAPPHGGFFWSLHVGRHGLLHLDAYWQARSAVNEVPERAVLFNRLHEALSVPQSLPSAPRVAAPLTVHTELTEEEARIEGGIGFVWMMLSIAAKTLARYPDADMGLMLYPKPGFEDAAGLLGQQDVAASTDWSVPELPADKVERLRHLVRKTEELTQAAIRKGLPFSPLTDICLLRYLDMVEGILQAG